MKKEMKLKLNGKKWIASLLKTVFNDRAGSAPYCKYREAKTSLNIGRSMLEMLGMLAVIGVLSVGGLFGYKKAMVFHKTNIILSDLQQCVLIGLREVVQN